MRRCFQQCSHQEGFSGAVIPDGTGRGRPLTEYSYETTMSPGLYALVAFPAASCGPNLDRCMFRSTSPPEAICMMLRMFTAFVGTGLESGQVMGREAHPGW